LDALARLVRFAVLRRLRVRDVAARYGTDYERALVAQGALPAWALDGIDTELSRVWPADVKHALGALP
ncbi:MAG: hypothetical protein M3Y87_25405, partial [Myxococcota bacterium]|nr:hypothetical protein [Myxococcota bacterium]